jgi:hypothetical protein
MTGLRDYIERRRDEIRRQLVPLEATAAELRSKLSAADAKLHALTTEAVEIEKALQAIGARENRKTTITIKEAILAVLADAPHGLTSSELLEAMNDKFFEGTLVRTSMSPQLSRLKTDGKIKQRGEKYLSA